VNVIVYFQKEMARWNQNLYTQSAFMLVSYLASLILKFEAVYSFETSSFLHGVVSLHNTGVRTSNPTPFCSCWYFISFPFSTGELLHLPVSILVVNCI
jgi:hypothetical protein